VTNSVEVADVWAFQNVQYYRRSNRLSTVVYDIVSGSKLSRTLAPHKHRIRSHLLVCSSLGKRFKSGFLSMQTFTKASFVFVYLLK